ncbi:hypothetical protein [Streptomyces sp. CB02923]|nr:hypothetical protein [Streptomyces sp. CB02923]
MTRQRRRTEEGSDAVCAGALVRMRVLVSTQVLVRTQVLVCTQVLVRT